jgi:septal ring factor EnvC (AmiA/AmiB activator)
VTLAPGIRRKHSDRTGRARTLASLCLCGWLALSPSTGAAETATTPSKADLEAEYQSVINEIESFKKTLEATRDQASGLEDNLRDNEKQMNDLQLEVERIQQRLKTGEQHLSKLEGEQRKLNRARGEQQALIEEQVRSAYEVGNQGYFKVMLNQEDPNLLSRVLTYYDYLNRARADEVERFRQTILELGTIEQAIIDESHVLTAERGKLEDRHTSLQATGEQRKLALWELSELIARTGIEIEKKTRDKEQLEALLRHIALSIARLPSPADTAPFGSRRGKLAMPVTGKIVNRFGSKRAAGKLRWDGVFIETRPGTPVNAIHYGRVVFSDWLRGFGLLLIISHGDGYMSLYGHNSVLYRQTGDWVTEGETIATSGDTGGQSRAGLYFAIRNGGKPADPQRWCQSNPRAA